MRCTRVVCRLVARCVKSIPLLLIIALALMVQCSEKTTPRECGQCWIIAWIVASYYMTNEQEEIARFCIGVVLMLIPLFYALRFAVVLESCPANMTLKVVHDHLFRPTRCNESIDFFSEVECDLNRGFDRCIEVAKFNCSLIDLSKK